MFYVNNPKMLTDHMKYPRAYCCFVFLDGHLTLGQAAYGGEMLALNCVQRVTGEGLGCGTDFNVPSH